MHPILLALREFASACGREIDEDSMLGRITVQEDGAVDLAEVREFLGENSIEAHEVRLRWRAVLSAEEPLLLLFRGGRVGLLLPAFAGELETSRLRVWGGSPSSPEFVLDAKLEDWKSEYLKRSLVAVPRFDTETAVSADTNPRRWFFSALWSCKADFLQVLPASVLINAFALAMPLFIMNVYDRVVPNHAFETLWVLATGAAIVFFFEFVMRLLRGVFLERGGKAADRILSGQLFDHMLNVDLMHRPASAGVFAGHARSYDTVREFFTSAALAALIDFPFSLLLIGLVFWLAGAVGYIPLGSSAAILLVCLAIQPAMRRLSRRSLRSGIQRSALTNECVNGLETIKALNAQGPLRQRMDRVIGETNDIDRRTRTLSLMGSSFTALAIHLTTVLVIVASVYQIAAGRMSMGAMIACVMVVSRAMAPLNGISVLLLRLQQVLAALGGLHNILGINREDRRRFVRRVRRSPSLFVEKVTFSYPDQPLPCLRDITIAVPKGSRIGVIGRAGSGKTTLLRLLCRIHAPTEGLVRVDGAGYSLFHPAHLRRVLGYLPQNATLFHGTIMDNLRLGAPGASDAELMQAAERVGLLDWTDAHPDGMYREVGEGGVLLSGGQRRAVALARLFVTKAPVLLLDEPTAGMDPFTKFRVRKAIAEYLAEDPERSLVIATHDSELLELVDWLVVLKNGAVQLQGPKADVIAKLEADKSERTQDES
ncbi:MAG: ATP-binding cassette domain-containing protein [Verrucomicrobiota bacterium]